jgi:acyl-CoA synthetase (AMP-forming)/AMP-acid ligase II
VPASDVTALGERIAAVTAIDPAAHAIEFRGRWRTWGEVGATIEAVAALVPRPGTPVGVLLRNRPAHVGVLLGVLRAGGCVVTINPGRGVERTRDDVAGLDLPYLAGTAEDLAAVVDPAAAPTLLQADELAAPVAVRAGRAGGHPDRPGVAVRMLTSGTSGAPTRVDLATRPSSGSCSAPSTTSGTAAPSCACDRASPSSTRRSCTWAGSSGCSSA